MATSKNKKHTTNVTPQPIPVILNVMKERGHTWEMYDRVMRERFGTSLVAICIKLGMPAPNAEG